VSLRSRLAKRRTFIDLWNSGARISDIAKRYGCSHETVKLAGKQLGKRHPNANELGYLAMAPSSEEEQISQDFLELAPSVARRAERIKMLCQRAMERGEPSPFRRAK